MANFFERLFRVEERKIKKIGQRADKVIAFENKMRALSDDELRDKTVEFRRRLSEGETLADIEYEAFAVAREAAQRTLGQFPYRVQIMGAIVLNQGDVAEMRTGEGKTLTATMSVYLNALNSKGVHVVTVNEYLAQRDAEWMGQIYRFLGLTVGVNLREKTSTEKQDAYNCDITYTTNSEVGFDYLRDNMAPNKESRVLRGLEYAVIDEADSILIDESRTPLIISGGSKASASAYRIADRFVKTLKRDTHFTVDIKDKTCSLTDDGVSVAEKMFGIPNLYNPENNDLVHRIHQALKANYIMGRDVEYMVDANHEIQLIDQFTGRVLKGREYSDGLQQAIQAKENVDIKQETMTMATITYQNFFRLYKKLSGMTGTAKTEEEEFQKIYNMRVITIPTNRPIKRHDDIDLVFAHNEDKLQALIAEVKKRHEIGQPILIGTTSVESSEKVSRLLEAEGLIHNTLNAKNHEREAEIIKHAGEKGAITIATNMAGRGTDIKLGPGVVEVGGLCVFGTERHESRRIDNQLRGRSGRQGDPGYSRFYVSFDDELLRRFASDSMQKLAANMGNEPLENKMFMNAITGAQKRIEGQNFDTRKNLLDYDDVLAKQRTIIYARRDKILYAENIKDIIDDFFATTGHALAVKAVNPEDKAGLVEGERLKAVAEPQFLEPGTIDPSAYDESQVEEVGDDLAVLMMRRYAKRRKEWGEEIAGQVERSIALRSVDRSWTHHIDTMDNLRQSIHLRGYANRNPLQDYVNEGYALFKEMMDSISIEAVLNLLNAQVQIKKPETQEGQNPDATNDGLTPEEPALVAKEQ
ncbi:MAG: preprotein translocase subunit SecA [Bacilli bacterium]|jgi:preprotein translocase subunit SecA|nr:preprotein translocase subunit SecA [Bacilli bacterium]MCH4201520.1 preprotein translocase subunit SecA [Bacilli bacterium]MCH4235668.1 preprotein translocase subunit SecA [Bacilli bacterium]